jgi:hypothetical protein
MTDGCFDDQLSARFKAKLNLVPDRTTNPSAVRHPRDGGIAHAGRTAHNFEDPGHSIDTLYSADVSREIAVHQAGSKMVPCEA